MTHTSVQRLGFDGHGLYLGIEKGCFIVTDTHGHKERFPLFEKEIGEVVL